MEITTASHTVLAEEEYITANRAGTVSLTFPSAALWKNRVINVNTIQAQTVVSAASNIIPITGGAAGTAILAAADGAWCKIKSNGTAWVIVQAG